MAGKLKSKWRWWRTERELSKKTKATAERERLDAPVNIAIYLGRIAHEMQQQTWQLELLRETLSAIEMNTRPKA